MPKPDIASIGFRFRIGMRSTVQVLSNLHMLAMIGKHLTYSEISKFKRSSTATLNLLYTEFQEVTGTHLTCICAECYNERGTSPEDRSSHIGVHPLGPEEEVVEEEDDSSEMMGSDNSDID